MNRPIYYKRNNKTSNRPVCSPAPPKKKKIKFDIIKMKKNTINSLNEVECFLNNFNRFFNYVKLYKILK